jgi:hypothetical protein
MRESANNAHFKLCYLKRAILISIVGSMRVNVKWLKCVGITPYACARCGMSGCTANNIPDTTCSQSRHNFTSS